MAQSFVREDTYVICTEMTSAKPAKMSVKDRQNLVTCEKKGKPLLNREDKKLSCSLSCRIAQSFFGALGALLCGLAVGAFCVFAIAVTFGAAAAVITAAATVAGILASSSLVASSAALYCKYGFNDCDDGSLYGEWELYHQTAFIQKQNALLIRSILKCKKGGFISFIPDEQKAVEIAEKVSDWNERIGNAKIISKFAQGVIGNGINMADPTATGIAGLVLNSGREVYGYFTEEGNDIGRDEDEHWHWRDAQTVEQNKIAEEVLINSSEASFATDDGDITFGDVLNGDDVKENLEDIGVGIIVDKKTALKVLTKSGADILIHTERGSAQRIVNGAFWKYFVGQTMKKAFDPSQIGHDLVKGIFVSMINNIIEFGGNYYGNEQYKNILREIQESRKDMEGNINITAATQ